MTGSDSETDDESLPGVCVVTHPLAAAGENATRSLLDIIGAITAVSLVTADLPAESEIRNRFPVIEVSEQGAGDSILVAALRFVRNQIRMCLAIWQREEQVILFYGATSYLLPILFARLVGKRVLVEPRGDVPLTLRLNWGQTVPSVLARTLAGGVRLLERAGFATAHGIVTYTPNMAKQLHIDPGEPSVYPTGARYVQTDRFTVETPFEDREKRVGFLGRLDEEKNVRELAAAIQSLPDDITFTFIGDGDLRTWLESELSEEIQSGKVEMRGWVEHDDVPAELNRLKLIVLPSEPTEGLPTTILEALACGTPVCASPVSGVPDVVRDGETGFLVGSHEPTALSRRIRTVLSDENLSTVSENGRELIERDYSFEAACHRYRRILAAVSDAANPKTGRRIVN